MMKYMKKYDEENKEGRKRTLGINVVWLDTNIHKGTSTYLPLSYMNYYYEPMVVGYL